MAFYYPENPTPVSSNLIRLDYQNTLAPSHQASFELARDTLNLVITERLSDVRLPSGEITDQVVIDVSTPNIDGSGGVLGQAGPTSLRSDSMLTASGTMEFDAADLDDLEAAGLLDEVVLHEMLHVLGIGTLWDLFGLIQGEGTASSRYIGARGREEYGTLLGSGPTDVPLETMAGVGSNDSHWAENAFDEELMTPFLNPGLNPLARLTIAGLDDLGYTVDYSRAESYSLPGVPLRAAQVAAKREEAWVCGAQTICGLEEAPKILDVVE